MPGRGGRARPARRGCGTTRRERAEEAVCRAGPSLALIKYWGKSVKGDNLPATPEPRRDPGRRAHGNARLVAGDRRREPGLHERGRRRAGPGALLVLLRHAPPHARASPRASAPPASTTFPPPRALRAPRRGSPRSPAPARAPPAASRPPRTSRPSRGRGPPPPPGPCSAASSCFPPARGGPGRSAVPSTGPTCASWWPSRTARRSPFRPGGPWRKRAPAPRTTSPGSRNPRSSFPRPCARWRPGTSSCWERRRAAATASCTAPSSGAQPPLLYWLPATVAVIHACAAMRAAGIGAWETIDAGPQVKILCLLPRRGRHCRAHGVAGQRHPDHRLPARPGPAVRARPRIHGIPWRRERFR